MWDFYPGVSARRKRKLRQKWKRASPQVIEKRREELGLDRDGFRYLLRWSDRCRDFHQRRRILTILHWANGWPVGFIAEAFRCDRSTVHRTIGRFREEGPGGLVDRRKDNGPNKVDEEYLKTLVELVRGSPQDFGERRPTWTRELLERVAARKTRVHIDVSTMSRALSQIGARLGRPRPFVNCPWSERKRKRRLAELKRLIENLPPDEVAFRGDEVDVHLNPKIGPDWMLRGQQKGVPTPGKNEKRYIAGAMHAATKKMVWVTGKRKTSALFINLLWRLASRYRRYRRIHVIVDNYIIHKSKITQRAVEAFKRKVVLHFLPPYCPNDNPIERVWQDFHANVTRNHRHKTMRGLMVRAERWLEKRNERLTTRRLRKAS